MATQTEAIRASSSLTPLCELAKKYGTDKLGFYTPIYDLILSGRTVFKMLEVGIGTPEAMKHVKGYKPGASLRMWREYFMNDYGPSEIYGIDINPNACAEAASEGIKTFCMDSTNTDDIVAAVPKLMGGGRFDLIIDDGSHEPADQLKTFQNLFPLLVPSGLYIIEDADSMLLRTAIPEHTELWHQTPLGTGKAILIRQEALAV